jgi:hypothetical protein
MEWSQGFTGISSTAQLHALFDEAAWYVLPLEYSATGGYDNGPSLKMGSNSNYVAKNCIAEKTKCIGFHVRGIGTSNYSANENYNVLLLTAGSSYIRLFNTESGIEVYRDAVLIASCEDVIDANLHHVEIKVFSDASAGTVQVKLDQVLVIDESSLDTIGDDFSKVLWGGRHTSYFYLANMFIANDWQGEVKHMKREATSDVVAEFTPLSGSDNYAMIDTNDGDTTYNSADEVGKKDLFGFEAIPSGIDVKLVTQHAAAKKGDTGLRKLRLTARENATDYEGNEYTLITSYPNLAGQGQYQLHSTTPAGAALTPASVNAVNWGYEVSA